MSAGEPTIVETALELSRRQLAALEAGDFDGYAESLPEYARICDQIDALEVRDLRASRQQLDLLIASDGLTRESLGRLKDEAAQRIGSLRRADRMADAYLPAPGPRFATHRDA